MHQLKTIHKNVTDEKITILISVTHFTLILGHVLSHSDVVNERDRNVNVPVQ